MVRFAKLEKSGDWSATEKEGDEAKFFLYCGWKKPKGFRMLHSFQLSEVSVEIWGRDCGDERQLSKWELPPPLDITCLYGNLLAVAKNGTTIVDIDWTSAYNEMFGGFDDLGSEDSESEDELENIPDSQKTKEGYLKDSWIASDDELEPESYD